VIKMNALLISIGVFILSFFMFLFLFANIVTDEVSDKYGLPIVIISGVSAVAISFIVLGVLI